MEEITLKELDWLIENNFLKCQRGKYRGLISGTKLKSGSGKTRWVEEPIYNQLSKMYKSKLVISK